MNKKHHSIFLTEAQINDDLAKVEKMQKQNELHEQAIPDYWSKGVSPYKWKINLILTIFLGFLGIDRFYLDKKISGAIKLILLVVITPFFLYICINFYHSFAYDIFGDYNIIIFSTLFLGTAAGFYFGDIIIAVISPRDRQFRKLVKNL